MKLAGPLAFVSTAFLSCHGEPKQVAREYLTALARNHHVEARERVIPECHEAPEGLGTLLTQLGSEIRHAHIELTVDEQTEDTALVSYTVRGQLHTLQHGTTSSLEHASADQPVHRGGQLHMVYDHEGWWISCAE